jgi:DNA-binding transcriptional MerR regulator
MAEAVLTPTRAPAELLPIQTVAKRFGINASTLRYYETIGLLTPASRHGGRRWYGPVEIRRLAQVLFWQRSGLMSLDEVAEILDRSNPGGLWQEIVTQHLHDLRERIQQMQRVESFVSQSLQCQHHECLDECPDYEELVWDALELAPPGAGADIAAIRRLGAS